MSLEQILQAIKAEGQAVIQTIQAEAEAESARIIREAAAEAAKLEAAIADQEAAKAAAERQQILQRARLKALETENFAGQMMVQQAIEKIMQYLQQIRSDPRYRLILSNLVAESLAARGEDHKDNNWIIQADKRDQELLEDCIHRLNLQGCIHIEYGLACRGGMILRDMGQRIFIDNTFERRLERAEVFLRQNLPEMLLPKNGEEGNP